MSAAQLGFMVFGLVMQAVLVVFFAARRWRPAMGRSFGIAAYACAALGLPLGAWLLVRGEGPQLWAGPLLAAAWAAYGAWVDIWRPRPWRGRPVLWSVLLPFVMLYLAAQMALWWPLWDIEQAAWAVFGLLFVVNTALNIAGHAASATTTGRA